MTGVGDFLITCALGGAIVLAFAVVVALADRWHRFQSPLTFPGWIWFELQVWARAAVSPILARRDEQAKRQATEIVERESVKAWGKRGPNGGAR